MVLTEWQPLGLCEFPSSGRRWKAVTKVISATRASAV